jgi:O-antigen/teichoic acid export membrane protein
LSGFARQASWLSLGRIIAAALQAGIIVVVARATIPSEFGIVVVFVAFAAVPQVLFDAGISTYSLRERAIAPAGRHLAYALRVGSRMAVLLALTLFLALLALGLWANPLYFRMLPLAIWAAAERNADLWLGLLVADGDTKKNVIILMTRRVIAFVLVLCGLWSSFDPVLVYSTALALSAITGSWWTRRVLGKSIGAPHERFTLTRLFRQTRHYWVNSLSAQVRNIDGLVVTSLAGPIQAGFYSMSTRLINPLKIIPDSLAGVLLPAAASSGYDPRPNRRGLLVISTILIAFLGVITFSLPLVVPIFLGRDYSGSVPCMQVIVGGLAFGSISSIVSALLMGTGQVRVVARIATITSVMCLSGVAIGAIAADALGAATGASLSFLVQGVLLIVSARKSGAL